MRQEHKVPIFAYPRLSNTDLLFLRIGGNGLGNLLFTWARCLAAAERHGWRMVWPTWSSFKPKNWRVNPHDHRTYSDLFRPTERYVSGWRKPWCLLRHRWVPEPQALAEGATPGSVVEFHGMGDKFTPFRADHTLVYGELLKIARPQHLAALRESAPAPIGIHVRRGDFVRHASYEDMVNIDNSLIPQDWFVAVLQAVRAKAGRDLPAAVYSDGTDAELAKLLVLPAVRRVDYGSSLGDMLGLSRSKLLIASGSTFSMWGSYLGQVPTLWHPQKLLQHVLLEHPEREIEWSPGDTLPDWVDQRNVIPEIAQQLSGIAAEATPTPDNDAPLPASRRDG